MRNGKIGFYIVWIILLSLAPIAIIKNTPLALLSRNTTLLINFIQRLIGLWAFTLLFVQIILGSFMPKLIEKLGAWVFKFHLTEGAIAYVLVLAHPLLFVFLNLRLMGKFDPFYVFTDVCVLCKDDLEFYYTFGRIAFWLITLAVSAALLRTQPWLQAHWRKFHILNYVAFFAIWFHSLKVGTDIGTFPFSLLHGPSLVVVSGIVLYRLFSYLRFHVTKPTGQNN